MIQKSVVINTRNEQDNLQSCIDSVKSWADEIIVVDMESTDQTPQIAQKNKVKFFTHSNVDYVEPARNFAISKASGIWILIIDADEHASAQMLDSLDQIITQDTADYVFIPRKNIIFGQWIKTALWWPDYNIRFFRKGSVIWQDQIHSVPNAQGRDYRLPAQESVSFSHYHYQSISQFIIRLDRYTDKQLQVLITQNKKFYWHDLIHKPAREFFSRYFAHQGYKDGVHGLALCLLQSFSELILYLKLWQHNQFQAQDITHQEITSQSLAVTKDFFYWLSATSKNKLTKIILKLKRHLI